MYFSKSCCTTIRSGHGHTERLLVLSLGRLLDPWWSGFCSPSQFVCLLCFLFSLKWPVSCLARSGECCLLGGHRGALHTFEFEVRSWTSNYLVGVVSKHLQRHSGSLAQGSVSPLWWEGVRTGVAPVSVHGGCLCTSCPVKEQRKGVLVSGSHLFPFCSVWDCRRWCVSFKSGLFPLS